MKINMGGCLKKSTLYTTTLSKVVIILDGLFVSSTFDHIEDLSRSCQYTISSVHVENPFLKKEHNNNQVISFRNCTL